MTKEIRLTNGNITLVSDSWYEYLSQSTWYSNSITGYVSRKGHLCKPEYMHRVITNAPKGMNVDHINGNKLDNRVENLRLATPSENVQNKKRKRNNQSGYKGVSYYYAGKWRARIDVDGHEINLGYYDDKEDAAHAYDEAARHYFGEFARTNFES